MTDRETASVQGEGRLRLADLAAGDEIELYLIASNEGWEWCYATVVGADEDGVRVRHPEGSEQEFSVARRLPLMRRRSGEIYVPCPKCDGTGDKDWPPRECKACDGTGTVVQPPFPEGSS